MENESDVATDYDSTSTDEEALGLKLGMCIIFKNLSTQSEPD